MGNLKEFFMEMFAPKTAKKKAKKEEKLSKKLNNLKNTHEGKLLLAQIEELTEESKRNSFLLIVGICLIVLAFVFGVIGQFLIVSVELIIGIILVAVGLNNSAGKRLKKVKLKLARLKDKKHK